MKVADIMTKDPFTLSPVDTIKTAGELFYKHKIDGAPVVDKNCFVIGIFTKSHLMKAAMQELDVHHSIENLMTRDVIKITPEKELEDAWEIPVGRLPVVNQEGKLIGILTRTDLTAAFHQEARELDLVKNLNNELDAIIESVSDGIYITDSNADTVRINSAYEEITGIKKEEVEGRNMKELVEEGIFSEALTFKVLDKKKSVSIIHKIKTGQQILSTGNPVFNEKGDVVRVVTTARDVDNLQSIRSQLKETKKLSERYYSELEKLRQQQLELDNVVIKSSKTKEVFDLAFQVAKVDSTVLISGESGVGKEIVATVIHDLSGKEGSFIKLNCGAIPANLLEAELFGYEEGAYTGAKVGGKPGMFELADGGTLFLDEIGEMPQDLQVKLLRTLQEGQIMRLGGTETININTRIVSATNRNLEELLNDGEFRKDLFYRLNVVPIHIPPLRERREDIAPLIFNFLQKFNDRFNKDIHLSLNVVHALENYNWPGNVRELENLIERLLVIADKSEITVDYLPDNIYNDGDANISFSNNNILGLKEAVAKVEKNLIKAALDKFGSTHKAAEHLDVSQPTVLRKAKKYNIEW